MKFDPKFEANFPQVTRNETVEKIIHQVKDGNFCQVIGMPGSGRSNLVGLLSYNKALRVRHLGEKAEDTFHFVPLNFSEIRGKDIAYALRFILFGIVDSLSEREMHEESKVLEAFVEKESGDELKNLRALKKAISFLTLERGFTIALLFDHFEEYVSQVDNAFFAHLASLQLRARYHFSVVFFLPRPLEQLIGADALLDVFKLLSGRTIPLPIKDMPLVNFLLDFAEKTHGSNFSDDVRKILIDETGGHTKLIKVTSEEVLRENDKDLECIFRESRAVRSVLYEIWDSLYPSEQGALLKLVEKEGQSTIDPAALEYLSLVDMLREEQFTIPLFHAFVRYRATHHLDDKISYNTETKRLYKGQIDLTERLTATEFAVLTFLLREHDRIVDRDEIVAVGWSDLKSPAGVSEQAIDQLLFRLRQKIEENPSDPKHLLTVKGRGIKFTP